MIGSIRCPLLVLIKTCMTQLVIFVKSGASRAVRGSVPPYSLLTASFFRPPLSYLVPPCQSVPSPPTSWLAFEFDPLNEAENLYSAQGVLVSRCVYQVYGGKVKGPQGSCIVYPLRSLEVATPEKINDAAIHCKRCASLAVLSRMQLTLDATRPTPQRTSCLVQPVSAWSVKARRAPFRYCRDARVYGHTTTAMHAMSTPPRPLPQR